MVGSTVGTVCKYGEQRSSKAVRVTPEVVEGIVDIQDGAKS